ncbi:hypothetical protein CRQ31_09880 [Salmonella enterica subsp. enterica serovar Worthington]|uniref:hypothetical protein n=1 Tax=Salmonella enterica TaxID=28901 RepID=UPI000F9FEB30|nr:hypothetical protein [Salmonella enterica]EBV7251979.1 hypothetical protein [Salmonella enterica subsp. enterica serovar Pomona]ECF3886173.1 hypothetical protein [Salmonella enterica subsp. enterica serovar Ank]EDJ9085163.1 hypothetical protein [Salmonella enterica subsp. enterica serovar Vitkin]EGI5052550.1 hypothetical protein [Salmonella enterica subsp. enterica serovar Worthington]EEJ1801967.1 hypothetical protein [Salmonella enterica subsp. enterica serovar Pomona]
MKTNLYSGITIVGRDSNEWHRMWEALGKHKANRALPQPTVAEHSGEMWQYMETREVRRFWFLKRYVHLFRHRMHPTKGINYCVSIPASQDLDLVSLDVSFMP